LEALVIVPVLLLLLWPAPEAPVQAPVASPFAFRIGFWTNLHHFLYVLGRARNAETDAARRAVAGAPKEIDALSGRSDAERAAWEEAVRFYAAGPSKLDAVFDKDTLVRDARELAAAADDADLSRMRLSDGLAAALTRAAPVYRAVWWLGHRQADLAKRDDLQTMVDRHGRPLVERLTAVYHASWPSQPRTVEISSYATWAGAYSTDGGLIVVASKDDGARGTLGLEILLHEASHQWDDEVIARLRRAADAQHRAVPDLLSHAMIFYTTGAIVKERIPEHTPYAEQYGLWRQRGLGAFKPALDQHWLPYLQGRVGIDDALAALLAAVPQS
jgi:hypothetical protein